MLDKYYVFRIIIDFLSKNWEGNPKYNVKTSVDLTSRNHYKTEWTINMFMPAKVWIMPAKTMSNAHKVVRSYCVSANIIDHKMHQNLANFTLCDNKVNYTFTELVHFCGQIILWKRIQRFGSFEINSLSERMTRK